MTRQMAMVGFLQAQNCTNLPSSWRHPQSRDDAHSADYYQEIAIVIDKKTGSYADPAKVKRLDHKGKFFTSRGPFTVPRSPQGHPVVIQAGASGRGQRFAGRWGEVIFAAARNTEQGKEGYQAVK